MTPAAVDGPPLLNVTVPLTAVPAAAVAGTDTVVVTSARAEIAVVPLEVSGCVLGPWLVVVPMPLATVTAPDAGAVNATPMATLEPAPSAAGMPVNVTTPVAVL